MIKARWNKKFADKSKSNNQNVLTVRLTPNKLIY